MTWARSRRGGYTLLEVSLVLGILVVIAAFVVPNFIVDYESELLPGSANDMRSLFAMVQAHAALESVRYRVRFPMEEEEDEIGGGIQPIVEREMNPIEDPEMYERVLDPWARQTILRNGIRCAEVRLGRPTIEMLRERERRSQVEESLAETCEDLDPIRPPVVVEPDGTSDWVVFVITNAPTDIDPEDLAEDEESQTIEVIVDGRTGAAWLQRPLYEEEIDLFEEEGWPIVLRQDFLRPDVLTENDVLELQDIPLDQIP